MWTIIHSSPCCDLEWAERQNSKLSLAGGRNDGARLPSPYTNTQFNHIRILGSSHSFRLLDPHPGVKNCTLKRSISTAYKFFIVCGWPVVGIWLETDQSIEGKKNEERIQDRSSLPGLRLLMLPRDPNITWLSCFHQLTLTHGASPACTAYLRFCDDEP